MNIITTSPTAAVSLWPILPGYGRRRTLLHQLIKVFSSIFLSWNKNKKFWSNNNNRDARLHPIHLTPAAAPKIISTPPDINPYPPTTLCYRYHYIHILMILLSPLTWLHPNVINSNSIELPLHYSIINSQLSRTTSGHPRKIYIRQINPQTYILPRYCTYLYIFSKLYTSGTQHKNIIYVKLIVYKGLKLIVWLFSSHSLLSIEYI